MSVRRRPNPPPSPSSSIASLSASSNASAGRGTSFPHQHSLSEHSPPSQLSFPLCEHLTAPSSALLPPSAVPSPRFNFASPRYVPPLLVHNVAAFCRVNPLSLPLQKHIRLWASQPLERVPITPAPHVVQHSQLVCWRTWPWQL
jgi:hypothetical protein